MTANAAVQASPSTLATQGDTPATRRWPRGLGLATGALVSLALWVGLIRLALAVFGG
jgi:hypothetical protein